MLEKCKKKKNKKGQVDLGLGTLLIMFIVIVVGLALVQPIFSNQAQMTTTYTYTSNALARPSAGTTYLSGQDLLSTPVVVNQTGTVDCYGATKNLTILEGINPTTGLKGIKLTVSGLHENCTKLNVSYSYGAEGYVADSGARSIVGNIGLFAVLGLLAAVIYYYFREHGWIGNF